MPGREETDRARGRSHRQRLLQGLPVSERRLQLAGLTTAVVEGGEGPPLVLLHGPGEHAAKWVRVLPQLLETHRVVAPDLPGHGAVEGIEATINVDRVMAWLADLIASTCESAPILLGHVVGGAVALRFTAVAAGSVEQLILVDSLGLAPFAPEAMFGEALGRWIEQPDAETHDGVWQHCAFDLGRMQAGMGANWSTLKAYNIDRLQTPAVQSGVHALMEHFGLSALEDEVLSSIRVPTSLIWGRNDLATSVAVAEEASRLLNWPLHVIDDCGDDPPLERPDEFLAAFEAAVTAGRQARREASVR